MRRDPAFWVSLAVAFVLGLLPGLALMAYQRQSADRSSAGTRSELQAEQTVWKTERQQLSEDLSSAEESATQLQTQVASLTAQVTKLKTAQPYTEPAAPAKKPPVITERSIDGSTTSGSPITLVVKVKGEADKVTMRLVKIHPDTGWVKTYTLEDTGLSGGIHVWRATVTCPSVKGEYRFFADAYLGDMHVTMPGVSAWSILVE
ncbi:MAG TPA: hypothetical protein VGK50_08960 [Coriobacteriia bacterium]|jgi:cell wall-associated NlpC family hydrolase